MLGLERMQLSWLLGLVNYTDIVLAIACFFLFIRLSNKKSPLVDWPFVGMLPSLLLNVHRLHDWYTEVLRLNKCTVLFKGPWFSGMHLVVTCDPQNVNYILSTANYANYPKGEEFSEIFDILGDGILNADDASWKLQRKLAHTHLRHRQFRQFVIKTTQAKVEKGLLDVFQCLAKEDRAIDLQDLLQRFTFDATCILVCGVDPGCLSAGFPTVPFAKAVDEANEVILLRHTVPRFWWRFQRWLKVGQERRLAEAWAIIDRFIALQISTRRAELERPKKEEKEGEEGEAKDLLTLYMQYQNSCEKEMERVNSDTFLRDTTLNMLVAGRDTTSAALSWFFWLISEHPSVEKRILEELKAIPPKKDTAPRVFDNEDLTGAVYLHAAICESLRLFSPVPLVHKGVVSPDVLPSGLPVRPGMKIFYSLYAMARMESVWGKDCSDFKPERWISDRGTIRFDYSDKFLVFNAGPRSCMGRDISFTQMRSVASALLYNFEIKVIEGQKVAPKVSVILRMENGLMVKIKERHSSSSVAVADAK